MNLGETATYGSLKCVFLCGCSLSLYRLRVLICPFVGELVWWECKWHLLSGCADICHLGRGGAARRGAKAGAGCEARLPLCSVNITALLDVGSDPTLWRRSLCGQAWVGSVLLKSVFSPSPGWDPCLREGGVLKLGGPGDLLAYLICRQRSELFPMSSSFRHLPLFSCSAQTQPWLQVPFVPHSWSQPRDFAAPLCLETHLRAHRALLDSPSVLGHEVWWRWSSCHQKPRLLLRHCVRKWWQWLLPVHQGSGWGQSNLCVPGPSLLGCDHPESTAQRDRVSGARASSQLGLRWAAGCLWETSSH